MAVILKGKEKNNLTPQSLIIFQIVYVMYMKFFIDGGMLPRAAYYLNDVLNIVLFCMSFGRIIKTFEKIKAQKFLLLIIVMLVTSAIGLLLNNGSIILYVWGLRNIGRMFIFWINCIVLLDYNGLIKIFYAMIVSYCVNFVISMYQYFVQGLFADNLGGIFGTITGANLYTMDFLSIVSFFILICYLQKQISIIKMLGILCLAMIIAPLAELKAFFFVFAVMLLAILVVQKRMNFRIAILLIVAFGGLLVAIKVLEQVFPDSVDILSIEGAMEYLEGNDEYGYSGGGDLSRTGAIPTLYEMFFSDDFIKNLFGFGLGSTETSGYEIFNSSFYEKYEYLHYTWFFDAMLYLETGVIGLIEFAAFYTGIAIYAKNRLKEFSGQKYSFICLGCVMGLYAIFSAIYNASLRVESGYLLYFIIAVPFIIVKEANVMPNQSLDKSVFKLMKLKVKVKM